MTRSARGFSLIESIVAMAITLTVTAGIFGMVHPARRTTAAELEVADLQQRLRVAADALSRDLLLAGAGSYLGPHDGALGLYLPPVMPSRQGATGDDPPGAFTNDRITLLYVPPTAAETTLLADLTPGSLTMELAPKAGCPGGANLCGFARNLSVLVYDEHGNYDLFPVESVDDGLSQIIVSKPPDALSTTYAAGAKVVEAVSRTYALRTDPATGSLQLTTYDGTYNAEVPVVDHVVRLSFDYFGEPLPPAISRPLSDESGPWTTYGPKPPDSTVKPTAYPAGENCAFARDADGEPVPRLATLGAGPGLVQLTAAQLTDGPWCPDAANANRWDADLLRIRKVAVTLRVEAAAPMLRGPAGPLFLNGGSARGGLAWVPDQEVRFEIAPRNLNLGR
ncbi:MAG TPA: prepilin-type N-terminal cleavage/methylation domain-containing protein [Vicinamibacterales bacterium]